MSEIPKGGNVAARYRLEARIGRGGMCEVYRATALAGPWEGRVVAIKRLLPDMAGNPQAIERFITEADISILLRHPHIVEVVEAGEMAEGYFIAMEHIEGRDLAAILERCRGKKIHLPVDFSVYVVSAILSALEYAHEALSPRGEPLGIVHCDVTPGNVFISRNGEIKLGDFGIARSTSGTASEVVEGKPYYLSPEAIAGYVTAEADRWAAAATLYELLTLHKPFTGKDPDEVFAAICRAKPTPVRALRPDVPEALSALVARALAPKPAQRFPTAAQFAGALEAHYDERIGNPLAIAAVVRGMFG